MSLHIEKPPPTAYKMIADAIKRMSIAGGTAARAVNVSDPSRLNAATPHKVFVLDADDIVNGRMLDVAQLVAWRFLLLDNQTPIAAVELSCDGKGNNLKFASVNVGPFVVGTRAAILQAEGLDVVNEGEYDLRALRAPSVYVMAIWLKDRQGTKDLLIPITPSNQAVAPVSAMASTLGVSAPPPHPPQEADTFLNALRPAARQARTFDSSPQRKP